MNHINDNSKELAEMIIHKKEMFAVEIRSKKNKSNIQRSRAFNSIRFSEDMFYDNTIASNIYKQIVNDYSLSRKNEISSLFHIQNKLQCDQQFNQHMANIENFSQNHSYESIIRSLIIINAYLRLNNMSIIDVTQKLMDSLVKISILFQENQTDENYYLSVMALQNISVISFFPINLQIFTDNLFRSLLTWVDNRNIQLEGNCFQALYNVSCADESIEKTLIMNYKLVQISLDSLSKKLYKLKILNAQKPQQTQLSQQIEEITKELVFQILKIIQDCYSFTQKECNMEILEISGYQEEIIPKICSVLKEYHLINQNSILICMQILRNGISSKKRIEFTFNCILEFNLISIFYQIIDQYMMLNEKKIYEQIVLQILHILLVLSSSEHFDISKSVYTQESNLQSLINIHRKENELININSFKVLYNICIDNKSCCKLLLQNTFFWQNIIHITEVKSNDQLLYEILLIMDLLIESFDSNSMNIFLQMQGMIIFQQLMSKIRTDENLLIVYRLLSYLVLHFSDSKLQHLKDSFIEQCNKYQIIQYIEYFTDNSKVSQNIAEIFAELIESINELGSQTVSNCYNN